MMGTNFLLWLLAAISSGSMMMVLSTTRNDVAFVTSRMYHRESMQTIEGNAYLVALSMGKSQQRQMELLRKLETIKQQELQLNQSDNLNGTSSEDYSTSERSEFSQLLANYKPTNALVDKDETITRTASYDTGNIPITSINPLTKKQSNKKIVRKAPAPAPAPVVVSDDTIENENRPLQIGDIAKRIHFETLVNIHTKQVLGPMGAAKLVPWVPPYLYRNIIIIVDPRKQSGEFRTAIQYLISNNNNNKDTNQNIIAITADTIEEITPWIRREHIESSLILLFSDSKLEWMNQYSIPVGVWSLCIMLIDENGIIQKLVRNVDAKQVCRVIAEVEQDDNNT